MVGIGVRANATAIELVVTGPNTFPRVQDGSPQFILIALPDDVEPAVAVDTFERLAETGGVGTSPALSRLAGVEIGDQGDGGNEGVGWSVVGGAVALTVAGIVIASAFAAGARRQLTTLGQLSANGAAPAVLRRVLFLQGTWIGVVGAALGLGLGAAALAMFAPYRARVLGRDVGPYDLYPTDLLPVVALALVAATLAAMVPASGASRLPTLAALAGRRPLGRVPRWLTLAGLAGLGTGVGLLAVAALGGAGGSGGAVWTLLGIVGAMAVLLGACAVAPRYVAVLEPVGQHLGGAWRLAARSLARQRTRTGAVVSAVCATGALSVAAATVVAGGFAADADDVPIVPVDQVRVRTQTFDDQTGRSATVTPSGELVSAVEEALGDAETSMVTTVAPPAGSAFLVGFGGGVNSASSAGGADPVEGGLAPIDGRRHLRRRCRGGLRPRSAGPARPRRRWSRPVRLPRPRRGGGDHRPGGNRPGGARVADIRPGRRRPQPASSRRVERDPGDHVQCAGALDRWAAGVAGHPGRRRPLRPPARGSDRRPDPGRGAGR